MTMKTRPLNLRIISLETNISSVCQRVLLTIYNNHLHMKKGSLTCFTSWAEACGTMLDISPIHKYRRSDLERPFNRIWYPCQRVFYKSVQVCIDYCWLSIIREYNRKLVVHNHFFHHNNLESIANGFAMKTMATLNVVIKEEEEKFQSLFDVFPP